MVILGEFSYFDNFNDYSVINLTHRLIDLSVINIFWPSRTKKIPSSHRFWQKIGTKLFHNVLNPAHVPLS